MPLHTQVDESSQDEELDVNPVYVRELSCEIPRYRLPEHSTLPRTALQVVRDELHARRQRPAQPGHVRHHLDGAGSRAADGRVRSTRT